MLQITHLKNDLRQIMRDPIMFAMAVAPLMMIILFKLMIVLLIPFLQNRFGFDLSPYLEYVLVFVVMMGGALLGIVTGFMMIDERDGNISELMSVTPLGREGYLFNRLLFAAVSTFIYSILGYYILSVFELPVIAILFAALLSSSYSIIIGLLIFAFADDKVKGLTFAKAINALSLFAFTDLLSLKWLTALSWLFPPYWITQVVRFPQSFLNYGLALLVNLAWLVLLIIHYWKRES